jgi:hypothetical protein
MTLGRGPCSDTKWENKKAQERNVVPVDQDCSNISLQKCQSKDFKTIYPIQQMDGLNDILWEDEEKVGNIGRQCNEEMETAERHLSSNRNCEKSDTGGTE